MGQCCRQFAIFDPGLFCMTCSTGASFGGVLKGKGGILCSILLLLEMKYKCHLVVSSWMVVKLENCSTVAVVALREG